MRPGTDWATDRYWSAARGLRTPGLIDTGFSLTLPFTLVMLFRWWVGYDSELSYSGHPRLGNIFLLWCWPIWTGFGLAAAVFFSVCFWYFLIIPDIFFFNLEVLFIKYIRPSSYSVEHRIEMRFRFLSVLWSFGVELPFCPFLNLMEIS